MRLPAERAFVSWAFVLWIGIVFTLAGLVKGVIGMGLPTVAVALLGLTMAPAHAAALMLVPSFATNVWQGVAGSGLLALVRRIGGLLAGIVAGTALAAAGLLRVVEPRTAGAALGVALMLYAAYALLVSPLRVPRRHEGWMSVVAGVTTGLVSGATGVFVMPSVPYLQALDLTKDQLVQALGLTFTVATASLAVALAGSGHLDLATAGVSALALAPAVAGMLLGQAIRQRVSVRTFRLCFLVGTFAVGAGLTLKALS